MTKSEHNKLYHRSRNGYLVRSYHNISNLVSGKIGKNFDLYYGLNLTTQSEFREWAIDDAGFNRAFHLWEINNFNTGFAPAIKRIIPERGYILGNMEWTIQSENSRRGGLSNWR